MTKPSEVLHPVKVAARLLGISVWTLRKKAYERNIGSVKIGSKLLIPQSELDWLIEAGTRPRRSAARGERCFREGPASDGPALGVTAAGSDAGLQGEPR